jgi:hypothetical protein
MFYQLALIVKPIGDFLLPIAERYPNKFVTVALIAPFITTVIISSLYKRVVR